MRPHFVVQGPPSFDGSPGIGKRPEPMHVQAVVSEGAVEALDEAVLHRLSGLDQVELDPSGIGPGVERSTSEFRPIVRNNCP